MSKIVLENVSKSFGDVKAVDNVNMEVKDGEFMVLLGPSGCGKTTTLRLIAGLERPTSGKIYFDDEVVNDFEPKERNVAMVFQDYALYPHMSVFNNMTLCLKVDKVPRREIIKRVKETAKILGIDDLLHRKPGELSGGQKQRAALGRAIIRDPAVYLMDEPLSNLDAKLRVNMRAELKKLHKRLGTTTMYVTHDQEEAMEMADEIAVMAKGRILQIGRPREIYERPINKFIAGFIGSPPMNFLECSLLERDGEVYLDMGSFRLRVPDGSQSAVKERAAGSEVIMGIRPEHISVDTDPKDSSIEARISLFQQRGNIGYAILDVETYTVKAMVSPDFEQHMDKKVFVKFDESRIHIFNKTDETAII